MVHWSMAGYNYTSFFGNKNQYNVLQNASNNRKYL